VVCWKENEIEIPAQGKFLSRLHRNHLDIVWLAALEMCVCGEQVPNPGRDSAWREESCRTHRLELALTCPVGDPSEMVDVAVADYDCCHSRQRAVGATRIEGEMELWQ